MTAEGSKRQRRSFHKLGQVLLSDIYSLDTAVAKIARGSSACSHAAGSQLGARVLRRRLASPPAERCASQGHGEQEYGLAQVCITKWVRKGIVPISETLPSYKSAIWHFILLVLKSYKNLKLAMVSFHRAAKCITYFNYE